MKKGIPWAILRENERFGVCLREIHWDFTAKSYSVENRTAESPHTF